MRAAGADREVGGCRFFALCGSENGRKKKHISWSRLLYEIFTKALKIKRFQMSDQKFDGK